MKKANTQPGLEPTGAALPSCLVQPVRCLQVGFSTLSNQCLSSHLYGFFPLLLFPSFTSGTAAPPSAVTTAAITELNAVNHGTFLCSFSHTFQHNNLWSRVLYALARAVRSKLFKIMPHNEISQGGAQKPANKASNASGWGFRECCSQRKNCNKTRSKHNPWFVFLHCKRSPVQLVSSSEQFWSVCTKELFTVCAVTSTEEHSKFLLHGQQEFIFLFFSLGKKKISFS